MHQGPVVEEHPDPPRPLDMGGTALMLGRYGHDVLGNGAHLTIVGAETTTKAPARASLLITSTSTGLMPAAVVRGTATRLCLR